MEIFTDFNKKQDLSLVLGYFDGLHLGHKAVILSAIDLAKKNKLKSALITFKKSPFEVLHNVEGKYILPLDKKVKMLEKIGIDYLYLLDFNKKFAEIPAQDYLKNLINNFHPKFITTGYNHTFGFNKLGNAEFLASMQKLYGYKYNEIKPIKINDIIISSSKIRTALANGEVELVNKMLGYKFFMENEVIEGQKLGRTIGFRTANLIFSKNSVQIPNGVYAVEVEYSGKNYKGIANYGTKPTVTNVTDKILEVHILDFNLDIYGKKIKVNFLKRLRDEKKFASLEELKNQIKKDIECLR